jgi:hypothetical protein
LIENHGTDVEHWTKLYSDHLDNGRLKVTLLLHQIHGVCWMHRMETLPGLGLNSLLWEKRHFPEGDAYYYSPALGQLRLALGGKGQEQGLVKGGILADEMGRFENRLRRGFSSDDMSKRIVVSHLIAYVVSLFQAWERPFKSWPSFWRPYPNFDNKHKVSPTPMNIRL